MRIVLLGYSYKVWLRVTGYGLRVASIDVGLQRTTLKARNSKRETRKRKIRFNFNLYGENKLIYPKTIANVDLTINFPCSKIFIIK